MRIIIAEYTGESTTTLERQQFTLSMSDTAFYIDVETNCAGSTYYDSFVGNTITEALEEISNEDTIKDGIDPDAKKELLRGSQESLKNKSELSKLSTRLAMLCNGTFT